MRLTVPTGGSELKINGVSLTHCAAWRMRFVNELLFEPELRGEYTTIPGMDGKLVNPLRWDDGHYEQPFILIGDVDHTGAAYVAAGGHTARQIGFVSNLNYLHTNVTTGPSLTGNRTRAATLTVPGEAQPRTADVHVSLRPPPREIRDFNARLWNCTLVIRCHEGMFV